MAMISLTGDVLIQVYNEDGLTVRSYKAGTADVSDDDLALLQHYAASSFAVVEPEAPAAPAADPAPPVDAPAPAGDESKDAS